MKDNRPSACLPSTTIKKKEFVAKGGINADVHQLLPDFKKCPEMLTFI